jgi:micrococcal nuclease
MRKLLAVALVAFVLAAPAAASVRLVRVTSPIRHGAYATLVARVSRAATCSITVYYKSGPSHARGLYPKHTTGGRVGWTWKVGTRTTPGRWPIRVSCGAAGTLNTSFVVT